MFRSFSLRKSIFSAAALIAITAPQAFAIAPGDLNGDGLSDFITANVSRASATSGSTTWNAFSTSTGRSLSAKTGLPGDALLHGDFNGDGITDMVSVFVLSNAELEWRVGGTRSESRFRYGLNRDQPIVGDFDGNGRADAAVVRTTSSGNIWYMRTGNRAFPAQVAFGSSGDIPFAVDMNGDRKADLVALRKAGTRYMWIWHDVASGQDTQIEWGASPDLGLAPADFDGDGYRDLIVIRQANGRNLAYIRYTSRPSEIIDVGPSTSLVFAGNYTTQAKTELASYSRTDGVMTVYSAYSGPFQVQVGKSTSIIVRPDGSVIQGGTTTSTDIPTSDGRCSRSTTFKDGANGALWKPTSDGRNRPNPVFILPAAYAAPRVVRSEVVGNNGGFQAKVLQREGLANGDRAHFDVIGKSASALNAVSPIVVKLYLRDGSVECRTVTNPTQRED